MKVCIIIGIFIIATGGYFYYKNMQINQGTYMPWRSVTFTYKDYTDTPGIDDPAFYEIVKQKNAAGGCNVLYTKYSDYPIEEVRKLAQTDTDAMFEVFARLRNDYFSIEPKGLYYEEGELLLEKAAERGHIQARLILTMLDATAGRITEESALNIYNKYEKLSPLAVFGKMVLADRANVSYEDEPEQLKQSGNHNLTSIALRRSPFLKGTDYDLLCEAYFNGCDLYKYKTINNIICN